MIHKDLWLDTTPQHYYIWTLRAIGVLAFFINTFGIYLILYYSTRALRTYKYYQLAIQLSSTVTDLWFSFAMEPVQLFPLMAGYCEGFAWTLLGWGSHVQMWYKASKLFYITITCVAYFPGVMILLLYLMSELTTEQIKYIIIKDYPNLINLLLIPNMKLYDPRYNPYILYFLYMIIVALIIWSSLIVVFTAHVYSILDRQQQFMSTRTHAMHKSTVKTLLLQASIPLICYSIPVVFVLSVVLASVNNMQVWCNGALICFSLHASLASIVMIATTVSYRNGVRKIIKNLFGIGAGVTSESIVALKSNSRNTGI